MDSFFLLYNQCFINSFYVSVPQPTSVRFSLNKAGQLKQAQAGETACGSDSPLDLHRMASICTNL